MTRKQFIALAEALRATKPDMTPLAFVDLVCRIADVCAATNPNFLREKFIAACHGDDA